LIAAQQLAKSSTCLHVENVDKKFKTHKDSIGQIFAKGEKSATWFWQSEKTKIRGFECAMLNLRSGMDETLMFSAFFNFLSDRSNHMQTG